MSIFPKFVGTRAYTYIYIYIYIYISEVNSNNKKFYVELFINVGSLIVNSYPSAEI